MTGLVVGSMVPDFEYFLRLKVKSIYSHTWHGLFWFDLPLALILCFVFQALVRKDLLANLPIFFQQRLTRFGSPELRFPKFAVLLLSILIGACSHLSWDAFTHADGFMVRRWPTLSISYSIGDYRIPGFKIAQHGSTVIGVILIILSVAFRTHIPVISRRIPYYWLGVGCTTLVLISVKLLFSRRSVPGDLIVTSISGFLLGIVIMPLILKVVKLWKGPPPSGCKAPEH